MRRYLIAVLLAFSAAPAWATDVGVSVTIGEPGFYGHIDIGDFPPPRLLYAEPVIVDHVHLLPHPVYLHVPPGHAKHWHQHCHDYHACNRRVYFVETGWYEEIYVPEYRMRHGHPGKGKKGKHKD
jgi:hypothetical protein